ncbi:uncharacterized protein MELLADRAFT_102364 [Melampsora larici-populina 98AG31]|uniref:Uncharacterized protein n=1 Tax=Melampsora larici-populina (strain 98AG31 / pathotype 3-4-7) TaxID=747676 RepID=F4R818_MELLP|nr:uncharacterized protein MELLADRAFT_102364 [Melampsora larici-populina 98AG31]EGG11416.1 hypothetical protein MELLADRAFT_102364 [Melampsora larici-populina 98AG31]
MLDLKYQRATREHIFAAKEELHQLAEIACEEEARKAAQANWKKAQAQDCAQEAAKILYHQKQAKMLSEREKARSQARAQEDLLQHNKTVKQVLNQAAKLNHKEEVDGEDGDSRSEEDDKNEDNSVSEGQVEMQI